MSEPRQLAAAIEARFAVRREPGHGYGLHDSATGRWPIAPALTQEVAERAADHFRAGVFVAVTEAFATIVTSGGTA
jgi:hypothetical protein